MWSSHCLKSYCDLVFFKYSDQLYANWILNSVEFNAEIYTSWIATFTPTDTTFFEQLYKIISTLVLSGNF